jgi:uncharacterized membrane protein
MPRNEVFQAIPFDASSDASEPLIAAGDAEEDYHRLQEKVVSRFKFSYRLSGLLVGFFSQFYFLAAHFLLITVWGEDVVTKSKTRIFVLSLLCCFFFWAIASVISGFLRNRVATAYSAIGGRSKELLDEMVLHMENHFVVGFLIGLSLACTMSAFLWKMTAQTVYCAVALLVGAFLWYKIMMMRFATNIKPSSSRRSMMAV